MQLAAELNKTSEEIDLTLPISNFELDSLSNLTLVFSIEEYTNLSIDPTVFEEFATFTEVIEWIQHQKK
jgi:acyl carrier protein